MHKLLILTILIILSSSTQAADITTGLVGYWKMDENSGTVAGNSSGDGNAATLAGGTTWFSGYTNSDLNFDGVSGHVVLPNNLFSSTAGAISLWVKVRSFGTKDYIWVYDNSDSPEFRILFLDGNLYFNGYDNGAYQFQFITLFSDTSSWHHYLVTWQTNDARFYIDGVLMGSDTAVNVTHTNISTTNHLAGNYWRDGQLTYFKGQLDEVRLYNRVLTAGDVNTLYYCQPPTVVAQDWIIDGNVLCSTNDMNITLKQNIGKNIDVRNGTLLIDSPTIIPISSGNKVLIRWSPIKENWLWIRRGGQLLIRS